ncbi:hypothetical protein M5K25_000716 [Dendrobium thyrsiflorum]|uniref:Uncharacterized protein n=1 Tax=Dendrobium thyrsiflorum TaxID=117978 RepID=A0ABD0VWD7_DENTH
MDTPLAAAVHKENVHIGGGKAKTAGKDNLKTAGKERKALADLRRTSKDVDLKKKSAKVKQHAAAANVLLDNFGNTAGKERKALADLRRTSKDVDLKKKSAKVKQHAAAADVLLDNFGKGNTPSGHILTDEEIKQCCEWAKDGIEGMGGCSWSAKDEANLVMNQSISDIMALAIGIPISELENQCRYSDEEGYETDASDLNSFVSVPAQCVLIDDACLPGEAMYKCAGRLSSFYTQEELDDPLGVAEIVLDDYPLPELKLNDDYGEFSIAGIDGTQSFGTIGAAIWLLSAFLLVIANIALRTTSEVKYHLLDLLFL